MDQSLRPFPLPQPTFYTSSPRPCATSLGFYPEKPDDFSDIESTSDTDNLGSCDGEDSNTSTNECPPATSPVQQPAATPSNGASTIYKYGVNQYLPQYPSMMPPPAPPQCLQAYNACEGEDSTESSSESPSENSPGEQSIPEPRSCVSSMYNTGENQPLPHFSSMMPPPAPPCSQMYLPSQFLPSQRQDMNQLDQRTLQTLMVNPELLHQLNEAASKLMATRISSPVPGMPPPPQFQFPSQQPQQAFSRPFSSQPFPSPSPSPIGFPITRPAISAGQTRSDFSRPFYGQPLPSPSPSPVGFPTTRPVITSVQASEIPPTTCAMSQPLLKTRKLLPTPPLAEPKRRQRSGKICMVCGDDSAGPHYGVMSCYACTDFFRRRVLTHVEGRPTRGKECCNGTGKCVITRETRNVCRCCRFQKCFDVGMKAEYVRSRYNQRPDSRRCQSALPPQM